MKKSVLAVLAALSLAACGGGEKKKTSNLKQAARLLPMPKQPPPIL